MKRSEPSGHKSSFVKGINHRRTIHEKDTEDKMEIIRIAVPAVLESLISVVITTIDT